MAREIVAAHLPEEDQDALDGATVFDPEDMDALISGVACGPGGMVAVYFFDALVSWFMRALHTDADGAVEFVEYNMLRAVPYMGLRGPYVLGDVVDPVDLEDGECTVDFQGQTRLVLAGPEG